MKPFPPDAPRQPRKRVRIRTNALYGREEVARALHVGNAEMTTLVAEGLPNIGPGRAWLFYGQDVIEFLRSRSSGPNTPK